MSINYKTIFSAPLSCRPVNQIPKSNTMTKNLFALLSCILFTHVLSAQVTVTPLAINAGGGTAVSSYYQYEWSVGETASVETLSSPSLIVTTGLLQAGTGTPASVNTANLWGKEEVKILPNPVVTQLEVDLLSKQSGQVTMLLIDASGRTMGKKEFRYYGTGHIEKWNMSAFANGQYFLSIILIPDTGSVAKKGGFHIQKIK